MTAPSVKEVLALSRAIDTAEQERAAAAQRKAELTAKLEALIGIAAEPIPEAEREAMRASLRADGLTAEKLVPKSRRMPKIETEPDPTPSPAEGGAT